MPLTSLDRAYEFAVGRSAPVKRVVKLAARTGLGIFSRLRGFQLAPEMTLMSWRMLLGTWEPGSAALCRRILRPGMTVIDIGAHVGYYTRLFARSVGAAGKVYAFEPHPRNFAMLTRNTRGFRNVVPRQMAITDAEKTVVLYESASTSARHTIWNAEAEHGREIPVPGASVSSLFRGLSADLVKIDVEGGELGVLRGAEEWLAGSKDVALLVEFAPPVWDAQGMAPRTLLDTLTRMGFDLFAIGSDRGELIPLRSWDDEKELRAVVTRYEWNLYARKRGQA